MGDSSYIESYNDISVHQLMLEDKPRTQAYRDFIHRNKQHIQGKTVMDVGSGTGILSMFAATAGAKKVYAVEASEMNVLSEKIIKKNKMDGVIQVLSGKVEEIQLEEKVDVIVSEWMGFYLLHESMLSSVLVARDRFLSEDGVILPSSATLYAAPTSLLTLRRHVDNTWKNVYGFDFSPVADEVFNSQLHKEPLTDIIPASDIVANAHTLTVIHLKYADVNDFNNITSSLTFKIDKPNVLRGVTLWFDVSFSLQDDDEDESANDDKMILSTSPFSQPTHWKQTTIPLPTPILVSQGDTFECSLNLRRDVDDTDPEGRRYKLTLVLPEEDVEMLNGDDVSDDDIDHEALHLIMQALNK